MWSVADRTDRRLRGDSAPGSMGARRRSITMMERMIPCTYLSAQQAPSAAPSRLSWSTLAVMCGRSAAAVRHPRVRGAWRPTCPTGPNGPRGGRRVCHLSTAQAPISARAVPGADTLHPGRNRIQRRQAGLRRQPVRLRAVDGRCARTCLLPPVAARAGPGSRWPPSCSHTEPDDAGATWRAGPDGRVGRRVNRAPCCAR